MKLHELKLHTGELERLRHFYTRVLELPLLREGPDGFTVGAGASELTFARSPVAGDTPFYHFAFDVPTNRLDESAAWLTARGLTLNTLPDGSTVNRIVSWNASSVYFYDSAGNLAEFIARHDVPHATDTPFSAASILGISEIGLVVDDVTAVKGQLQSRFGIEGYRASNESFAALGDELGLFVLSARRRIWLGSDKEALVFPTEVIIEGAGAQGELVLDGYPYTILSR